jgi:hypothetical protein
MGCIDCHTGDEIHGYDRDAQHRYDGAMEPNCIDCHADQVGIGSGIEQHEIHGTETVSCQVCHSVAYTNCFNCHVERTEDDIPFFSVEAHSLNFYIGRNPMRSAQRPFEYTTLRHAPVDPTSFSFYGDNLLPNFDSRPTWLYATPHNIQRNTPQTASCESCHGNDSIFLTRAVVDPALWAANASVMVEGAPPLPADYVPAGSSAPGPSAPADDGGFWGDAPAPTSPPAADFWGDAPAPVSTPAPTSAGADFWGEAPATPTVEPTQEGANSADAFWGS